MTGEVVALRQGASKLQIHPLALIFPQLSGPEFEALVGSIKENGLRESIWLFNGKILDGRNRYNACIEAGVSISTRVYEGDDPLKFVIDQNVHRRHLTETQRAMVAGRLATLGDGVRSDRNLGAPIGAPTQPEAADLLHVARRSVQRARTVLDGASPSLVEACDHDLIAVSLAAKLAEKTDQEFQDAVVGRVKSGVGPMEAIRVTRAEHIARSGVIAPSGKYRILYADPPWSYGNTQQPEVFGEQRDHYAVMSLADICAEPVKDGALCAC